MDLAARALDRWATSPLLSPSFHRTGWVMLDEQGSDLSARIRKGFADREREGRGKDESADLGFEDVRTRFAGLLAETDFAGFDAAYWNPGAGWAEADRAVAAMLREAVERGVEYVQGEAEALVMRPRGEGVEGVRLSGGRVIRADRVVLATGAWTSQLLQGTEDELGIVEEGRVEGQAKAAGVCVAHFRLSGEEMERWSKAPVVVYGGNGALLSYLCRRAIGASWGDHPTCEVPSSEPRFQVWCLFIFAPLYSPIDPISCQLILHQAKSSRLHLRASSSSPTHPLSRRRTPLRQVI